MLGNGIVYGTDTGTYDSIVFFNPTKTACCQIEVLYKILLSAKDPVSVLCPASGAAALAISMKDWKSCMMSFPVAVTVSCRVVADIDAVMLFTPCDA
jgi:hypothetical protein